MVLVVEDDLTFAKVLLEMAREQGFKGLVALDGRTGVDLAHQYQPDAITLDLDMPGVDGFAVLERLKRHPDTRHIPVHIISGVERRHEGLQAGAIAYLEKPVSAEALDDAFGAHQHASSTAACAGCWSSRTTRRSATAIVALIGTRTSRSPRSTRPSRRSRSSRQHAVRLHGARPRPARDERLRAARAGEGRPGAARPADHRLHGQGADARRRTRASGSTPRRSSSRT